MYMVYRMQPTIRFGSSVLHVYFILGGLSLTMQNALYLEHVAAQNVAS